jgi:hypothetical protein
VDIVTISKSAEDNPRNVWSVSKINEAIINLYIEFEDGRLVCYEIDKDSKTYKQLWTFTTIQTSKVVAGDQL